MKTFAAVIALLPFLASPVLAQTPDIAASKSLWESNNLFCKNCHGKNGEGAMGPDLAGRGLSASQFRQEVRKPWGVMPAFTPEQISDAEIDGLTAYFASLSKVGEPAAWRVPLTPEMRAARRDSLSRLRAATVAQILTTIQGHEDEPARKVFKSVELLRDMPARQFLALMDTSYGRALSVNCTSCHVADKWADETRANKARTRIMIQMTNAINEQHLVQMPKKRDGTFPTSTCMTCHRGSGTPNSAILP